MPGLHDVMDSLRQVGTVLQQLYGEELREAINKVSEIRIDMMVDADQHLRSQRLLHLLEQAFHNYPRVENLVRQYVLRVGQGCACGFEVFRLLRQEFSVQTRNEAMSYRNKVLEWSSSSRSNLLDIVRMFEVEVMQFHGMLYSTANPHLMSDLRIRDADLYLVLMRNLPERVQLHCQLHAGQTFLDLRQCVEDYHHRTRIVSDHGKLAKLDVDRKGKGGKDGNKGGKDGNKGSGKDGKGGYGQESGKGKKGKEGKSESKGKGKGGGHEKGQGDARQRCLYSRRCGVACYALQCDLIVGVGYQRLNVRLACRSRSGKAKAVPMEVDACVAEFLEQMSMLESQDAGEVSVRLATAEEVEQVSKRIPKSVEKADVSSSKRIPKSAEKADVSFSSPKVQTFRPSSGSMGSYSYLVRVVESEAVFAAPVSGVSGIEVSVDCQGSVFEREHGSRADMVGGWLWDLSPCGSLELELESVEPAYAVQLKRCVSGWLFVLWMWFVLLKSSSVEPEPVTVEPVVAAPDVEMGASNVPSEIGDERMELDMLIVNWHEAEREKFLLRNFDGMPSVSKASCYKVVETSFCGLKVEVPIPHDLRDENTGDALSPEEVYAAVRVELDSLTALRVGKGILEKEAQRVAKEAGIRILSSRWVLTQKSEGLARARLVVKDFRTYGKTPVLEGIYSPTGSIEGLRIMLAFGEYTACFYGTLDVSTAFMFANLPQDSLVLVRMPPSILSRNQRVTLVLWKAMNGLREGPLRWYTELTSGLEKDGFQATAEVTLWRRQEGDGSVTSVLIYVDDLLVSNPSKERVENVMVVLEGKYKVKRTGWLSQENPGQLKFLGRLLTREWAYGPLTLGLSEEYVDEILHVWNERLKPTESLPKLEDLLKSEEKKEHAPLTAAAVERYRKVLGMLAWASVSRCDLLFVVGFLSRGQSSPTGPYESCLRAVLKWITTRRAVVQTFPASAPPSTVLEGEDVLIGYCDASWNNPSVSGGGISWNGHCLKMWSRKQSVPALSSAEAELASMVECLKELMHVGIVLLTLRQGIVYDAQGAPEKTTHDMKMVLHCDSTAANSISGMIGLLRKIRHVELRAALLQYCVRIRKVKVVVYEGALQPVDGLTKTPSAVMLKHLGDFVGLEIVRSLLNTPEPECDSWMEEDMFVIRVHRVPRSDLFVPDELSEPPVALGRIGKIRETVCVFVDGGSPIVIRDEWRESTFQLDSGMKRMWTGETRFELLECIDALADSVPNAANQKTVTFEMSPISPEPGTQDSLGKESLFMVSFRESMEKVQEWKKSVDRCAFDKVFHRWKFMCSTDIGEDLGGFFCMHGPQDHLKMDVTSKGFYPIGLARQLVQSAWRAVEG
eukprot:s420_g2.t1